MENTTKTPISAEMATKEVTAWLDYKRIKPSDRERNEQSVKALVDAVSCGVISIDTAGDFTITHKLEFPEGVQPVLKYKARAKVGALQAGTKNLNGVPLAMYFAYAQELTGVLMGTLQGMDSEDSKVLQAIVTFFL
jgi:hypothetical protein